MRILHKVNWAVVLPITALFVGCGTGVGSTIKKTLGVGGLSEKDIKDIIEASNTGDALSTWVYGGLGLFVVGAIMLAWSTSKRAGAIFMACGAGGAFTAYAIEEYAIYAVISAIVGALVYGISELTYKLGYERGKDHTEREKAKSLKKNEEPLELTKE